MANGDDLQDSGQPDAPTNPTGMNAIPSQPAAPPNGGGLANPFANSTPAPAANPIMSAAPTAGPGVMRGILGVFLSGLSGAAKAGPGPGGFARAAQGGAQAQAQNPNNPEMLLDSSMKKAQLALMQTQIQRQLMIYHTQEPLLQNATLNAWVQQGDMVMKNRAEGHGEILFQTSADQDPNEAFKSLNAEYMAHIKNKEYDVIPFATGDPAHPTLGLYKFANAAWEGGDSWPLLNPDDPEHPGSVPIPAGIKAGGASAVQKWGLDQNNKALQVWKQKQTNANEAANRAQRSSEFTTKLQYDQKRDQLLESGRNMRSIQASVRQENGQVQQAFQKVQAAGKAYTAATQKDTFWNTLTGASAGAKQASSDLTDAENNFQAVAGVSYQDYLKMAGTGRTVSKNTPTPLKANTAGSGKMPAGAKFVGEKNGVKHWLDANHNDLGVVGNG